MESQQAKMFVRSLSNSAARILVSFLFARTSLDVKELHEWTGMKRETLYDGLELLRSCGLLEPQTLEHGRQLWVPSGEFLLPGIFQLSEKRTPELQMSEKRTPGQLIGGGDSELINLNLKPPTPPQQQMSEKRTPETERTLKLLQQTNLLFDGSFVNSKGLEFCDPDTVLAWCAYAYDQARAGKADRPAGLVRRKLLDLEPAPQNLLDTWASLLPEAYLEAVGEIEYACQFCDAKFGKRDDLQTHTDQTHPSIIEEQMESLPSSNTPEGRAWQSVLDQLQVEMPRASFETWVRDTRAVRYDGNALVIGVRNAYARDWLESRLESTVNRLLVGILNQQVTVQFVTAAEAV